MTCGHCNSAVTAGVGKLDDVSEVIVDLSSRRVTVASDKPLDDATVAAAVDEAGHGFAGRVAD